MFRPITFLFLFALCSTVLASSVHKKAVAPRPASVFTTRQVSREKLIAQRERRAKMRRGELRPRASAKVYPVCSTGTAAGYARFAGYDYLGYDISTGAVAAENEAVCADLCASTSGCIGYFWYAGRANPCFRKITANQNSALIRNGPSGTSGAGAGLAGSCASLEQYYDASKMAVCCDSYNPYPTCSNTVGPGYARFPGWDNTGDDFPNNPRTNIATEAACITLCNNTSGCVGTLWWPDNRCYLKNAVNHPGQMYSTTAAAQTPGTAADLKITCNKAAAIGYTSSQMAVCCNTR